MKLGILFSTAGNFPPTLEAVMRIKNLKISVYRGWRAARFHGEFHRGQKLNGYRSCFLKFGIASPNHHRWWATTVYVYWKEM
jgi:hypothetical protein